MSDSVVLVTDHTWPSVAPESAILDAVGASIVEAPTGEEEELVSLVPEADAILTCFAKVTERVIAAGERLQVVGRYGIGVDNIAVEAATARGIPVTNVPAYCLDEVAEHVLALIFSHARRILVYNSAVHAGDWSLTSGAPIHRVAGSVLGIVGFGKIGQALAAKARGIGMKVIAFDPYLSDDEIASRGGEPTDLGGLATSCDYLSVHVPLTPETTGLVNDSVLRALKPSAFVVNTARGGVIDQDALRRALEERWIAGAGLDVFVLERLPVEHPLLADEHLIATPHVAFYSEESVRQLEILAAENVAAILSGRRPASVVNPQVLDLPRWAHLR